jgi:CHASE3 domain sensor protein
MKNKTVFLLFLILFAITPNAFLQAQGIIDAQTQNQTSALQSSGASSGEYSLPLKRVVILTSGLAYYEHSGSVNGSVNINIPFKLNSVNDALKTLIINDSSSANPSVTYQAENTLAETLRSLSVDLSDNPDYAAILSRLRGAQAEVTVSDKTFTGRIIGTENRLISSSAISYLSQAYLSISTDEGIVSLSLNEINSIKFKDTVIERDIDRALDLIAVSRNYHSRDLTVNLPGTAGANTRRNVSISYVIPSPVWKVSYRLDLGAEKPLFQGWAIVDNDSDTDWNNISLSFVSGRPASFIQQLYPPYYVSRPIMPLAIAGTAEGVTHDRSVQTSSAPSPSALMRAAPSSARNEKEIAAEEMVMMDADASYHNYGLGAGGAVQTAAGSDAGGQFEFTIKNPVSLNRRMSAMFPLVEANIEAKKLLIYSGSGKFPRLGAEITNTSKMKLPAGPITIFDGGVYAGDALIEFWNEGEKRLISFGEDLSVSASVSSSDARAVSSVKISSGVMTINRDMTFSKKYSFLNSGAAKQLVIEHGKTAQASLVSPKADEQTESLYRFNINIAANKETELVVNEQRPLMERITLLPLSLNSLISYTSNQEIPSNARAALAKAVELRQDVEKADAAVRETETQKNRLITDQDRIRKNLEAAGNQTTQGQEYLKRLTALDSEIDACNSNLERANANSKAARTAFDNYINGINL